MRHLLTHTSGLPGDDGFKALRAAGQRVNYTTAQLFDAAVKDELKFAAGERFLYSDGGYFVLGMIIEAVSGQRYRDFLDEKFFKPLGMRSTSVIDQWRILKNRAAGYTLRDGQLMNIRRVEAGMADGARVALRRDVHREGSRGLGRGAGSRPRPRARDARRDVDAGAPELRRNLSVRLRLVRRRPPWPSLDLPRRHHRHRALALSQRWRDRGRSHQPRPLQRRSGTAGECVGADLRCGRPVRHGPAGRPAEGRGRRGSRAHGPVARDAGADREERARSDGAATRGVVFLTARSNRTRRAARHAQVVRVRHVRRHLVTRHGASRRPCEPRMPLSSRQRRREALLLVLAHGRRHRRSA